MHGCGGRRFLLTASDARNRLQSKLQGMLERFRRARREAEEGCPLQADWLKQHAELIEALESGG